VEINESGLIYCVLFPSCTDKSEFFPTLSKNTLVNRPLLVQSNSFQNWSLIQGIPDGCASSIYSSSRWKSIILVRIRVWHTYPIVYFNLFILSMVDDLYSVQRIQWVEYHHMSCTGKTGWTLTSRLLHPWYSTISSIVNSHLLKILFWVNCFV
jgi:hypothetical protein